MNMKDFKSYMNKLKEIKIYCGKENNNDLVFNKEFETVYSYNPLNKSVKIKSVSRLDKLTTKYYVTEFLDYVTETLFKKESVIKYIELTQLPDKHTKNTKKPQYRTLFLDLGFMKETNKSYFVNEILLSLNNQKDIFNDYYTLSFKNKKQYDCWSLDNGLDKWFILKTCFKYLKQYLNPVLEIKK